VLDIRRDRGGKKGAMMEKYTPELLFGLMILAKNIVLIVACAWTTTTLYRMSGSWHCLWALLMMLAYGVPKFIRD
jgi:hypothetical protein